MTKLHTTTLLGNTVFSVINNRFPLALIIDLMVIIRGYFQSGKRHLIQNSCLYLSVQGVQSSWRRRPLSNIVYYINFYKVLKFVVQLDRPQNEQFSSYTYERESHSLSHHRFSPTTPKYVVRKFKYVVKVPSLLKSSLALKTIVSCERLNERAFHYHISPNNKFFLMFLLQEWRL